MKVETKILHSGYEAKNGEPRVLPIAQSTTFEYNSTEYVGDLFDLKVPGFFYTRLANPTTAAVEKRIAQLEGGVGALCTSSGQAASFIAILNLAHSGDHILSSSNIYGGTYNLFAHTLKKMGIEVTFVDQDLPLAELKKHLRDNTKVVFAETLANPQLSVLDFEKFSTLAHDHEVPLIVDNTFPTPYFCNPLKLGADIVTHSTTKYLDGHAVAVGGCIVDGGSFNWDNGKFPQISEPDPSYHGLSYTKAFGKQAYITKALAQLMRDLGCTPSPQNSFYLNLGMDTLHLRMDRHYENALKVATWLEQHDKIETVNYPGLPSNAYYDLQQKYLPKGCSGVLSITLKGDREDAARLLDNLKLIKMEVHVADSATCALHPASATHRQLSDEELEAANIPANLVRISVGLENADDIIADLEQALAHVGA
ncbi:O-acetylhomoserine aminocarboxypropyltransferase [Erysipelotrichaceae bacterium MTC7]|nr:O-acetylhomoserine aminocarboxypropyltransferase [Erysipelotrichaceae bacterium MTC7]